MTELVRQGFICPFCMIDLGDFPSLQSHVESTHPENGAAADMTDGVVRNVKGLFDRAKRGMRKLDAKMSVDLAQVNLGVSSSVADLASYASSVQEKVQERARPQPTAIRPPPIRPQIGVTRSHHDLFLSCRDSSVNESAVRTNMLIIRLDRLINEYPADSTKRKEFEREVVPWSSDSEYPVCRSCAAKFGLTRRRHHCRLCGRVMCHQCSRFLSFLSARKLTNPALAAEMENQETTEQLNGKTSPSSGRRLLEVTQKTTERMKMLLQGAVNRLNSDGSEVSLGSLLQQDDSECLRLCSSCLADLRRREEMMEQRVAPALAEQYSTLDGLLSDVTTMAPTYARMASSINNGETMYTLKAAEVVRQKIFMKQKEIDILSKNIVSEVESTSCGLKEAQLRKNIRFVAVSTLQTVLSGMTSLPNAEQYSQLVERHKEEIASQIEHARLAQLSEKQHKLTSSPTTTAVSSRTRSLSPANTRRLERKQVDEGWTPQQTQSYNPFMEEEDMVHPLFEQCDIIKGYLSQAADAGRLEEVEMLERNLHDIEDEMRRLGLNPGERHRED